MQEWNLTSTLSKGHEIQGDPRSQVPRQVELEGHRKQSHSITMSVITNVALSPAGADTGQPVLSPCGYTLG